MVLSSTTAYNLTSQTISIQDQDKLDREIDMTERKIRSAAGLERFDMNYSATWIGNPVQDVDAENSLTELQVEYRDLLRSKGFIVEKADEANLWYISWKEQGPEAKVRVYSFRTTVAPGPVEEDTIEAILNYFTTVNPVATARAFLFSPAGSGGDVPETDFGAADSTFYEYVAVVGQQDIDADRSDALQTYMLAAGLGYDNTNSQSYLMG